MVIRGAACRSRAARPSAAKLPDASRTAATSARHSSRKRPCSVMGNSRTATPNTILTKLTMQHTPDEKAHLLHTNSSGSIAFNQKTTRQAHRVFRSSSRPTQARQRTETDRHPRVSSSQEAPPLSPRVASTVIPLTYNQIEPLTNEPPHKSVASLLSLTASRSFAHNGRNPETVVFPGLRFSGGGRI